MKGLQESQKKWWKHLYQCSAN